jgi:hypothetical protein
MIRWVDDGGGEVRVSDLSTLTYLLSVSPAMLVCLVLVRTP